MVCFVEKDKEKNYGIGSYKIVFLLIRKWSLFILDCNNCDMKIGWNN